MIFFFNDTTTTEIYTLSLHDALPICEREDGVYGDDRGRWRLGVRAGEHARAENDEHHRGDETEEHPRDRRSEEHTSELQSRQYLVCRLLLEKKTSHTDGSIRDTFWLR